MSESLIKPILEAAIFSAEQPLTLVQMQALFPEENCPEKATLQSTLTELAEDYADRGVQLVQVASGYRFQSNTKFSPWLSRLWAQRAPRYSRALLETLAIIAYKQPITRGEIEDVRGVAVSSNIIRTLTEREWIKEVGHRDVPGRPALFATTPVFLDYFGLAGISALPPLSELMDLDALGEKLGMKLTDADSASSEGSSIGEVEAQEIAALDATASTDHMDAGAQGEAVSQVAPAGTAEAPLEAADMAEAVSAGIDEAPLEAADMAEDVGEPVMLDDFCGVGEAELSPSPEGGELENEPMAESQPGLASSADAEITAEEPEMIA